MNGKTFLYAKSQTLFTKLDNFRYVFIYKNSYTLRYRIFHDFFNLAFTVRLKSLNMFSGALILPHYYKSNLAHLLAFQNLVIEFLNAKR